MLNPDRLPSPPPIDPERTALFLDLDGTLAPFASHPDGVGPDPRRTAILRALRQTLADRLAVISGRTLDEIDRILEGSVGAAAGVHGLDRRRANGARATTPPHPAIGEATAAFVRFAQRHPGALVETKALSVALHYRNAPGAMAEAVKEAEGLALSTGLALQRGDKVAELRTPGHDKGAALALFMQEPPFMDALPVFVGDDYTDESAFEAAAKLGGYGVLVGKIRVTAARFSISGVTDVLGWLSAAT